MATTVMRFRKASDKDYVIIPEVGRVVAGQVLEGPQWKRYVAIGLLEEIPQVVANPLAKDEDFYIPAPKKDPPPAPPVVPPPPPEDDPVAEDPPEEETAEEPEESEEDAVSSPEPSGSAKMKKRAAARRKR